MLDGEDVGVEGFEGWGGAVGGEVDAVGDEAGFLEEGCCWVEGGGGVPLRC